MFVFPPTNNIFSKGFPKNSYQSILSSSPIILPELKLINKKNQEKQSSIQDSKKNQPEKQNCEVPEKQNEIKEKNRSISKSNN